MTAPEMMKLAGDAFSPLEECHAELKLCQAALLSGDVRKSAEHFRRAQRIANSIPDRLSGAEPSAHKIEVK